MDKYLDSRGKYSIKLKISSVQENIVNIKICWSQKELLIKHPMKGNIFDILLQLFLSNFEENVVFKKCNIVWILECNITPRFL